MSERDCGDTETDWCSGGVDGFQIQSIRKIGIFHTDPISIKCVCSCCACISEWVGGFEETWQQLPIQSSRQNATLTTVCTRVFFCFFVHHCLSQKHMKLGEGGRGGNMNALPARPLGIWGGFTQGKRKSERKVEMLPGAPHRRQTLYMRGGGEEE